MLPLRFLVCVLAATSVVVGQPVYGHKTRTTSKPASMIQLRHPTPLTAVAFDPEARRVILGTYRRRQATVWDLSRQKPIAQLEGHPQEIRCAAWTTDGKLCATGGLDGSIRLWDPGTGKETGKLLGHEQGVFAVSFSPDGRYLVSTSYDDTLRLWDVGERKQLRATKQSTSEAAFGPDSVTLAVGRRQVVISDLMAKETLLELQVQKHHSSSRLLFAADKKSLAALVHDTRYHSTSQLALYDLVTGKPRTLRGDLRARHMAFDGSTLVSAFEREVAGRDVATGDLLFSRTVVPERYEILGLSPNGRRFLAAIRYTKRRALILVGEVPRHQGAKRNARRNARRNTKRNTKRNAPRRSRSPRRRVR